MHKVAQKIVIRDIKLLQRTFGPQNVWWPPNLAWVRLNNYRLPSFYNRPNTDVLIIVPPHYGLANIPLEEFYLSKGLRVRAKRGTKIAWEKIPHYHTGVYNKYGQEGWAWYCIHPKSWQQTDNILTFVKLIDFLLQRPFKGET